MEEYGHRTFALRCQLQSMPVIACIDLPGGIKCNVIQKTPKVNLPYHLHKKGFIPTSVFIFKALAFKFISFIVLQAILGSGQGFLELPMSQSKPPPSRSSTFH